MEQKALSTLHNNKESEMPKQKTASNGYSLKINSLGLKDLNACIELDRITLNGLWNKQQWLTELIDSRRLCIGIYKDSKLVSFACGWLVVDELHLTAISVHPEHRNQGMGQKILSSLLQRAKILGCTRATLEVSAKNQKANDLYLKCGFKTVGKRLNYYKDGSDALIQWISLIDSSVE